MIPIEQGPEVAVRGEPGIMTGLYRAILEKGVYLSTPSAYVRSPTMQRLTKGFDAAALSRRGLLKAGAGMGIGAGAIDTRLKRHRLHRIHRGVYAVGHLALVPLAREWRLYSPAGTVLR